MKFVFFEVRSKTELYREIAKRLVLMGHEVVFIIQNHRFDFKSHGIKTHCIPYPELESVSIQSNKEIEEIIKFSDRFWIHFKQDPWYYGYYSKRIEEILKKFNPDYCFGELGNFFTHIGCVKSREMRIKFYDVETSRYPTGHISFFEYDIWKPLKIRDVSYEDAVGFLNEYLDKKPVPDYMRVEKEYVKKAKLFYKKTMHDFNLFLGYLGGEKFCTQNPFSNYLLKKKVQEKLNLIKKISKNVDEIPWHEKKIALYPMQMQPEFNYEVWGAKDKSQNDLIKQVLANLPKDWLLLIKLNPKSYFELLTLDICGLFNNKNLIFLKPDIAMDEVFDLVNLFITVTGTVQIEALLKGRPVYILGDTPFKSFSSISSSLSNLDKDDFRNLKSISDNEKFVVSKFLLEHSIPGVMCEPINSLDCLNKNNIDKIVKAITGVCSVAR